jgi:hypothetical protein
MSQKPMHAIERTSPKGDPFVGTCFRCGKTGLTISQSQDYCENTSGMSEDEALLAAIDPALQEKNR